MANGGNSGTAAWTRPYAIMPTMRRFLLLIPFLGTLIVPLYDAREPTLWGFPYFYWYLFAWLLLLPPLIWFVDRGRRQ